MRNGAARWIPVAVYAAGIFWLSSLSSPEIPISSDKVAHACEFALLGALVLRAANGGLGRPASIGAALLSALASIAYGVSDEWHQSFVPGRECSAADAAADAVGAALGVAFLAAWTRRPYHARVDR